MKFSSIVFFALLALSAISSARASGCCSDASNGGFCSDPNSKLSATAVGPDNVKYCCRAPGSQPQFSGSECSCSTPNDGSLLENCPIGSGYSWYPQPDAGLCTLMPDNTCQASRSVVCRRYKGVFDDGFCAGPGSSLKPQSTVACNRGTCTLPGRVATTGGPYVKVDRSSTSANKFFGPYFTITAKNKLVFLLEDSKTWSEWHVYAPTLNIVQSQPTRMYMMKDATDVSDLARDVILGASDSTGPLNVAKVWIGANSPGGYGLAYKWIAGEANTVVLDTTTDFNWDKAHSEPNYLIGATTGPDTAGEQCVAAVTTTAQFQWMDYYCTASLPALLEVPDVTIEYKFGDWPASCPATTTAPCGQNSRAERTRSCLLKNFAPTLSSVSSLTIPDAHCERLIDLTPELVNKNANVRACVACEPVPTDASFLSDAQSEFASIKGDKMFLFALLAFGAIGGIRWP